MQAVQLSLAMDDHFVWKWAEAPYSLACVGNDKCCKEFALTGTCSTTGCKKEHKPICSSYFEGVRVS